MACREDDELWGKGCCNAGVLFHRCINYMFFSNSSSTKYDFTTSAAEMNASPSSPQSVLSFQNAPASKLDVIELTRLLNTGGQCTPICEDTSASRELTPDITMSTQQWIQQVESLQQSINYLDVNFPYEQWRQNHVVDDQYWRIEADYWESCYANKEHTG
ncbi:hypothetical protein IFR05_015370 [Cadophora sp. M221]|nr:hypothetical protein IFR05_015370 [Cadophora sp. M221]